jgi:hypothetical protein
MPTEPPASTAEDPLYKAADSVVQAVLPVIRLVDPALVAEGQSFLLSLHLSIECHDSAASCVAVTWQLNTDTSNTESKPKPFD